MNAYHRRPQAHYARQSTSFAEKRRKRAILGTILGVVSVVTWTYSLSRLSFLPVFALTDVSVYGAPSGVAAIAIKGAAETALDGSYLGLFSKSNAFLYPKGAIFAAVASSTPAIDSVTVRRDGWHTLVVSVSEKTPAALVCDDLPNFDLKGNLSTDNDDCYAADETGYIFGRAASSTAVAVPERYYIPDLSDSAGPIGSYATSTAEFAKLQAFFDGVRSDGIAAKGILMKEGGEYELYAANPDLGRQSATSTAGDVVIYFNDHAAFHDQLEDLTLFWNDALDRARASGARLEWSDIKLSFPPNVYYTEVK